MGLPLPTMDELLRFAEKANAQRKATAERLLKDRVMTREAVSYTHLTLPTILLV